ncbi:Protein W01A8.8 [Aphelenchoides avenae]|nr:Protein W01A8.8 [Aphelenchus avenae]
MIILRYAVCWVVILAFSMARQAVVSATTCTGCDAYKCLEAEKHCGPEGYPLGFGYKYCRRFKEAAFYNLYDEEGKQFVDSTRQCLIGLVEQYDHQTPNATCTALKKYAWKTHEACYLRCGIRDISTETMQLLFETYDSNYYVGVEACFVLRFIMSILRYTLFLAAVLLSSVSLQTGASASNCTGCNEYKCLDDEKHCGPEGYPLGFGYKYCRRFKEPTVYNLYDAKGKQFIDCTRQCLIGLVEQYDEQEPNATCDSLKSYAWKTHEKCYLVCDFCDICRTNKKALYKTYDFKDFFSVEALKQVVEVMWKCGLSCIAG